MNLFDPNGVLENVVKQHRTENEFERAFICVGKFCRIKKRIVIQEGTSLEKYTEVSSHYKLQLNRLMLYGSLKDFAKRNLTYILLHTHPSQNDETLKLSPTDKEFLLSLGETAKKINYKLPIVLGAIGQSNVSYVVLYQNKLTDECLYNYIK